MLICTPARAMASLCLAGGLAAWHFWLALSQKPERSFWSFPFYPVQPLSALNVVQLTYLTCVSLFVCLLACVCRYSKGSERVFLAVWLAVWTLAPLKYLLTVSAATLVEGLQAAGMIAAFLAALHILQGLRAVPAE